MRRDWPRPSALRSVIVSVATSIVLVFVGLNSFDTVRATTPAVNGVSKPSNFPTRLPWAAGVSHNIGWAYGQCNSADPSLGDHCSSSGHAQDYYALDFDLGPDEDVYPISSGTVLYAGSASGGWGQYGTIVYMQHVIGGVSYESLYTHLNSLSVTPTGQNPGTQVISANAPIGKAGKSGCPNCPVHLHFAMYKGSSFCYPYQNCNGNGSVGPFNGEAVVPEPLIGEQVYEGFQWWKGPLVATDLLAGPGSPGGSWLGGATSDNSFIARGQKVGFRVHVEDTTDIKEVHLTAGYDLTAGARLWNVPGDIFGTDFPGDKIWRILAVCKPAGEPNRTAACAWNGTPRYADLSFDWDPWSENGAIPSLVNWLPPAFPAVSQSSLARACLSFDVVNKAGTQKLAPSGVHCSAPQASLPSQRSMAAHVPVAAAAGDDAGRLVTLEPLGSPVASAAWPTTQHDVRRTGRSGAVGPSQPSIQWSLFQGFSLLGPAYVSTDGYILTGSLRIKLSDQSYTQVGGSPGCGAYDSLLTIGTVFCQSYLGNEGYLQSITPEGSQSWLYHVGTRFVGSPTIATDGTIYVGTNDGVILAIKQGDNTFRWATGTADTRNDGSAAIGLDGTIYMIAHYLYTSKPAFLMAVAPNGTARWNYPASSVPIRAFAEAPVIGDDGTIYALLGDGALYAIAPDGSRKWRYAPSDPLCCSLATGWDGVLYVGTTSNKIYAVEATGQLRWTYSTPANPFSFMIDRADNLYFTVTQQGIYSLTKNGSLRWNLPGSTAGILTMGPDGTIYSVSDRVQSIGETAPNVGLTVTKTGSGSGTVGDSSNGINCGTTCVAAFRSGSVVTLTAVPGSGSSFTSWTGCDATFGTVCSVTLSTAKGVSATFTATLPSTYTLTVAKAGSGAGSVVSNSGGIDCGTTCSTSLATGSQVTLSATPATGSSFAGWSGDCSGTGSCQVTLSSAKSVTANFNAVPPTSYQLALRKTGTGSGVVLASPTGIDCGSTCAWSYSSGSTVTLTAAATAGSTFTGWGDACSGADTCTITMDGAKAVSATFQRLGIGLTTRRSVGADGDAALMATLTPRPGCGPIDHIQFGLSGNTRLSISSPAGGPSNQVQGFTYTPQAGTDSVSLLIQRVVQSGGAMVNIQFYDGCGLWRTFVGGGTDAFR